LASYGDTLTEIQNLHKKFRKNVSDTLTDSQETLVSKFDKYVDIAIIGNNALQTVKDKCKGKSKFAFWKSKDWKSKDCFGYDIPDLDPNRILNVNLGKGNVKGALRGVIQLIDPKEDVSKLEVKGKHKTILYPYIIHNTYRILG